MNTPDNHASLDFIRQKVVEDINNKKNDGKVITRFPPEPNGYLHIGHAKSICLNFGIARQFQGVCHLRFDDTNPSKEDVEYVDSIQEDVRWLGFDWGDKKFYASDYFEQLYEFAVQLIKIGKAFVCNMTSDEIRAYRGSPPNPGQDSPYRNRSISENLDLLQRMRNGEFEEGTHTLRAKIDMTSSNIHMRDPIIYRIMKSDHHRTGSTWCIYPMYDFAHCLSDMIEGITHSICTLEFEVHRPLYDWILDVLSTPCHPQQIEFARLNLNYTVMSKRKLLELVEGGQVSGWNDPRMPTIAGMRRRGYPPEAIRDFCERIGVAKRENIIDISLLEYCVREDLNKKAMRCMAVLHPLKVVLINYPETQIEALTAVNNPEDPSAGNRNVPFSRILYIEKDDFREVPPKGYFRLAPGGEVRLRYAYIIKCVEVVKDDAGDIVELRCTYDPETKSGSAQAGRKVKGTIHWVSAAHAVDAEVRLYDRLFNVEDPSAVEEGHDWKEHLNPKSLEILDQCKIEPAMAGMTVGGRCQFERQGYFAVDSDTLVKNKLVFNRTVTLKDTWAKIEKHLVNK